MSSGTRSSTRHAWLRALGRADMPAMIELAGTPYHHRKTYKHDFFAATGLYQGPQGRAILKIGRVVSLFGMPMSWLGRYLADHEMRIYSQVDHLDGVPRCLGRCGQTGFAHVFVEGHPLQKHEGVSDTFFDELAELIEELHRRNIAYVDLEKRENILVGDDGRPHLIDFQISWQWPGVGTPEPLQRLLPDELGRFIIQRLTDGDRYHLMKHRRRHRPDTMTDEQIDATYRAGWAIRAHRRLARPFTILRRRILKRLTGQARSPKQDGPEFV